MHLSPSNIDEIAAKLRNWGVFNATILGGEPFLYKPLPLLIKSLAMHGLDISLSSNGTVHREEVFKAISESKAKLNIALHSHQSEVNDSITRCVGSHRKLLVTIRTLMAAHFPVHITTVLHPSNIKDIADTISFSADLGIKAMTLSYPQPANYARRNGSLLSFSAYERAFRNAFNVGRNRGIRVQGSNHYNFLLNEYSSGFDTSNPIAPLFYGDKAGRSRLEMTPSCDLYPSSFVFGRADWMVGNLLSTPDLAYAWINSPILKRIRNRRLPTECVQCEHKEICGGGLIGLLVEQDRWDKPPSDCPVLAQNQALIP